MLRQRGRVATTMHATCIHLRPNLSACQLLGASQHSTELHSYQELPNKDRGHLRQRDEAEVYEHVPGQVLSIQCPGHVEKVVDSP